MSYGWPILSTVTFLPLVALSCGTCALMVGATLWPPS